MRDEIIKKRGYSDAIHGDNLSLTISSYPVVAEYLASRLAYRGDTLCELCCGIGVSLIEFSSHFEYVIGIDNDMSVIKLATKNLAEAGRENCKLVLGDVSDPEILSRIKADIVTYDIPYWSDHNGLVKNQNPDLSEVVHLAQDHITDNIVIYAPPHTIYDDISKLFDRFEYQEVWIDGDHDRNLIYLGSTIEHNGKTKVEFSKTGGI